MRAFIKTNPLDFCAAELERLESAHLRRFPRVIDSEPRAWVALNGRRVLQLASNNYLALSTHPEVVDAAARASRHWGAGAGAARLVTGTLRIHEELEASLAEFKRCEDAVLFSSGYLANLGAISALVGRGDAIFSDALNHASAIDGARLSQADVFVYRHADAEHLADSLAEWRLSHPDSRALVVTDSVFSMDGDIAPLAAIASACERHGAILMADEAHATGVVGPEGRGAAAQAGVAGRVVVTMGTLSKALGSAGGFIAGSRTLCDYLRNKARAYIFDTAPAPASVAAALAALAVIRNEPERPRRVRALARAMATGLAQFGYNVGNPEAAIVPVRAATPRRALALSEALLARDIWIPAIRPPSVPPGGARLRLTVTFAHLESDLERALDVFEELAAAGVDK